MIRFLDGVRVIDLTTILAGPFAAYQLGLFGADVIKVEMPQVGDPARELGSENPHHTPGMGSSFVAQNSGKRSITLDLKSEEGRDAFGRLVAGADVLLENMRPGVLARLGFPWARLRELNPSLVYCALSGFGAEGPLATRPAYDQIIQGLAGMAAITGLPDGPPLRVGFPIGDTLGGYAAAMAICAALARSERPRIATFLDVSMLDTALTSLGWAVSDQLVGGRPATRNGNDNVTSSPSGSFHTADGPVNIAANTQAQFESVCAVLGAPELLDDPRFATRALRKLNRAALTAALEAKLSDADAEVWEERLSAASVPTGRVLSVPEALDQEQVRARGLLHHITVRGRTDREATVLGSSIRVDGAALSPTSDPPLLGEHTDELLEELGFGPDYISDLRKRGAV